MKNTIKESILSYFNLGNNLYEDGPVEGKDDPEVNDPDINAENPNPSRSDLYKERNSFLFLTSNSSDGIIRRGDQMGWIEITKDSMEGGTEIDLEDFQWICPTKEFQKYLKKTGRGYDQKSGEWSVNQNDKKPELPTAIDTPLVGESDRKILSFENFIFENNLINEKEAELKGGELDDTQRKFIKFYFTKNELNNSGKIKKQLNINNLKSGQTIQIFQCPFDPVTEESDPTATTAVTFEIKTVIKAEGSIAKPMAIGHIVAQAPFIDKSPSESSSSLDGMADSFNKWYDSFEKLLGSTSGKIFTTLGAAMAFSDVVKVTLPGLGATAIFYKWKYATRITALMASGSAKNVAAAKAILAKEGSWIGRRFKSIKNSRISRFMKYPFKTVSTISKRIRYLSKRKMAVTKGWKAAKYALFGFKSAGQVAKIAKIGRMVKMVSSIGKWSNPIGWVLLGADAVGSYMNYTSDNQAPSWDPLLGGSGDSLKDYNLPGATNVFKPSKIKVGENITLCWTQNPESGWGLALSFVVSNSTRTTMDLTKIHDFKTGDQSFSLFVINNVNYEAISKMIDQFDLRFLFIKDGVYKEGWADDNIGTYFLGVKNSKNKEDLLPIAYHGHCGFAEFDNLYRDMPDQLVAIDENSPDEYSFYFEDLESNIINVKGRKINNNDIKNASPEEINDLFNVQPKSSFIGNPENESEEDKKKRMESQELSEKEIDGEENNKWYSRLEEKSIVSFSDFKSLKGSVLLEEEEDDEDDTSQSPEDGETSNTDKEFEANFETILDTIQGPIPFCIYIVTEREYANPELRNIYQAGEFTNFVIDPNAISAEDGDKIEELVQVNNLDVLLEARKGTYVYRESEEKETKIDTEEKGSQEIDKTETQTDKKIEEEPKEIMDKIDPDDLEKLEITDWSDITSVKVIRDKNGSPETIKIKNSKANFGDKSKRIEKNNPNFQTALHIAKEFNLSKPAK